MRSTSTWIPDGTLDALPASELIREIERLRAEVAELRGELARERSSRGPRRQTEDFEAPRFMVAAPAASAEPRSETRRDPPRAPGGPVTAPFALPHANASVARPEQGIDFGAVQRLTPEELDGLPYGLITLDAQGRVMHYNDTESRMVGLPKHKVIGRSFFSDVAPCTRVREFEGRFQELVRDPYRIRVQTFDFVFRFANGDQYVTIVMTPAKTRGQFNLALLRRQQEA